MEGGLSKGPESRLTSTVLQAVEDIDILSINLDDSDDVGNLEIVAALIWVYFWFCRHIRETYRFYVTQKIVDLFLFVT